MPFFPSSPFRLLLLLSSYFFRARAITLVCEGPLAIGMKVGSCVEMESPGPPLIYPFTHPYRRPGSCKGAPTLLADRATGRGLSFTPLFAALLGASTYLPYLPPCSPPAPLSFSSSYTVSRVPASCLSSISLPPSLAFACSRTARRFLRSFPFWPKSTVSCPVPRRSSTSGTDSAVLLTHWDRASSKLNPLTACDPHVRSAKIAAFVINYCVLAVACCRDRHHHVWLRGYYPRLI